MKGCKDSGFVGILDRCQVRQETPHAPPHPLEPPGETAGWGSLQEEDRGHCCPEQTGPSLGVCSFWWVGQGCMAELGRPQPRRLPAATLGAGSTSRPVLGLEPCALPWLSAQGSLVLLNLPITPPSNPCQAPALQHTGTHQSQTHHAGLQATFVLFPLTAMLGPFAEYL